MRAVGFTEFGGPEVLRIVSLPVPSPGPGQVRVRVAAAAVNPTDLAFRAGAHRSMPAGVKPTYVPGMDLAGVIDAVGADGADADGADAEGADAEGGWRPGDRVMAAVSPWEPGGGAQAEYVVVAADALARIPGEIGVTEAAALPMNALTVRAALDKLALRPGHSGSPGRPGPSAGTRSSSGGPKDCGSSRTPAPRTRTWSAGSARTSWCRAARRWQRGCARPMRAFFSMPFVVMAGDSCVFSVLFSARQLLFPRPRRAWSQP